MLHDILSPGLNLLLKRNNSFVIVVDTVGEGGNANQADNGDGPD